MDTKFLKKTALFFIITLLLCFVSFSLRNFLILHCNNCNFKVFQIEYIKNYGAAFSLLHTHTSFLITISIVILFVVLFYIFSNLDKFSKSDFLFASILTSGIICNLVERLSDGFVTDYIRLNFVIFPIFNVSDIFICIGAFVLICNILFSNESGQH